jgi:hypothetical protein
MMLCGGSIMPRQMKKIVRKTSDMVAPATSRITRAKKRSITLTLR